MSNRHHPLILIRAWFEPGSAEPLRAEIRFAGEDSRGFGESTTATSPEAAAEIVLRWLQRLVERHEDVQDERAG